MSRLVAVVGLAAAASALLLASGCAEGNGRSIVLYNGQHPQLTSALVVAFERQTRIDVRVRSDDSIVLADQIMQEGGRSAADVYLAENSPELTTLDEHRLLARLEPSIWQASGQASRRYSASSGDWIAMALRVDGLAYNPALVSGSALPSSMLALAQPGWKEKVGIAPTDSDFVPLVGAVIATHGQAVARQWLAGLRRNAQLYQNDESVVAAVNRGDAATGLINAYYWFRLRRELGNRSMRSQMHYFSSRDLASVQNTSGAAVLASSPHRNDAEAFVRFLASETAQRIIAHSEDFEYPVLAGVAPNPALPPLRSITITALAPAALGDDQLASRLIQQSGLA